MDPILSGREYPTPLKPSRKAGSDEEDWWGGISRRFYNLERLPTTVVNCRPTLVDIVERPVARETRKKKTIFWRCNPKFGNSVWRSEAWSEFRTKIGQNRLDKNRKILCILGSASWCTFRGPASFTLHYNIHSFRPNQIFPLTCQTQSMGSIWVVFLHACPTIGLQLLVIWVRKYVIRNIYLIFTEGKESR